MSPSGEWSVFNAFEKPYSCQFQRNLKFVLAISDLQDLQDLQILLKIAAKFSNVHR